MRTLDIGKLRQEREQLTKRIQQINVLLDAVAAFDGTAPKKAGRPKGKGGISAAGRAAIGSRSESAMGQGPGREES